MAVSTLPPVVGGIKCKILAFMAEMAKENADEAVIRELASELVGRCFWIKPVSAKSELGRLTSVVKAGKIWRLNFALCGNGPVQYDRADLLKLNLSEAD